jgi:Linalool dehydratase/isomerase
MSVDIEPPEPGIGYDFTVPDTPNGPVVTRLLKRTYAGAAIGAGLALWSLRRARTGPAKARALGALAPGAGYVYSRSPGRLLATTATFGATLVGWFGTGNIIAPPAVWAAAAVDAGRRAGAKGPERVSERATVSVPVVVGAAALAGAAARRKAFRNAQSRGRTRADYLRTEPRIDPRPTADGPTEHSEEDLATLRSFIDRGLAPLDNWDGYDDIEQFQTSSLRYQLFMCQWVLNLAQLHHTPSFHGYLSAAQRQLIDKVTQPKIWRYWAFEQSWGNLSLDWDPMKKDNIMLSGYLGVGVGAYESTTGDTRYREADALPFRLGKRTWPYSHDRLAEAVHRNMAGSDMTLYPCEPNWVYSACNMSGMSTLLLSDRLHGTDYAERLRADFRRRFSEEFITPDGRIVAIRSSRLGFTIPSLTSMTADASAVTMLHAFDTELARRSWTIVRREFVDIVDGAPQLALRGWDAIDVGNYRKGDLGAAAITKWAAAEMGDTELEAVIENYLDDNGQPTVVNGARWYEALSTQANAVAGLGRYSPPSGYRNMIVSGPGPEILRGPVLDGADYPAVQVALAVSDGEDLRLVLRSGIGGSREALVVSRLRPDAAYTVSGAVDDTVVADHRGEASFAVDLDGRTEIHLRPVS